MKKILDEKMYKQGEVYKALFLLENYLRVSMHNLMVTSDGENYFHRSLFPPFKHPRINEGRKDIDIITESSRLKSHEKYYNLMLGYVYPGFWYLEYRILVATLDYFWDSNFVNLFTMNGAAFRSDLIERLFRVAPIRNAVAHDRYVSFIDSNELHGLLQMINRVMKSELIVNFEQIVLNPLEDNRKELIGVGEEIINKINVFEVLPEGLVRSFKILSEACLIQLGKNGSSREIFEAVEIFRQYNAFPRTPGGSDNIRNFTLEKGIPGKIRSFTNRIGGLGGY
ncbi:MAG: hypothetical protein Q8Q08_06835 [Candidatus Omnitrophota bacterium]|nr:hypothetical protein [Candidatus Omnitrophota bacterium]